MKIIPLGAGQEIGRSCILLQIKEKLIMLDCGINVNYTDHRRFPDFSVISKIGKLSCILISHFHLDHCGALVQINKLFDVPVITTAPTKEIIPLMLEDLGDDSRDEIRQCVKKIKSVNLKESFNVDGIEIIPFYAGHVLGACMFFVKYGKQSCLYTGDFNSSTDNHLLSAYVPYLNPDALIIESTYGLLVRESRRKTEIEFLEAILKCVENGGKVLIPIFSVGRAQEIFALIENFWIRNQIEVPLFSTSVMTEVANKIYRKHNSYLRNFDEGSTFEFKKIKVLEKNKVNDTNKVSVGSEKNDYFNGMSENIKERNYCVTKINKKNIDSMSNTLLRNEYDFQVNKNENTIDRVYDNLFGGYDGPMVVFASPGMLQSGQSLYLFKKWYNDPKNMIIFTGYCSKGSIGHRLLNKEKVLLFGTTYDPKIEVKSFSFSSHSDFIGIQKIILQSGSKNIVLVHGEKNKMVMLKRKLKKTGVNVFIPENGKIVHIPE
ncbi:Integrator complex subunit 11 [Dictyocoela muelleri]|nr:Integrator complex subunit 11 [Dictyocoela muelleri]